jgi:hypothetical protein
MTSEMPTGVLVVAHLMYPNYFQTLNKGQIHTFQFSHQKFSRYMINIKVYLYSACSDRDYELQNSTTNHTLNNYKENVYGIR